MANNILHHEEIYRGVLKDKLNKPVLICGAGAIGSNLADTLTRQGFTDITVLDNDRVEKHNINTQIWDLNDIGALKVAAAENRIYCNTQVSIKKISKLLDEKNYNKLLKGYELIIDGFDNTKARKLVYDYGSGNNTAVLHGGLFEDFGEVIWNERYTVPQVQEGLDVCDYPLARNIITLTVTVMAEEIMRYFLGQTTNSWTITLKDFNIRKI